MSSWVNELRQQCGSQLPIVIVGNKSDLESNRQIKLQDAEDYARQLGVQHFSASARTGNNVKELFKALTESKLVLIHWISLCACRNRVVQSGEQVEQIIQNEHAWHAQRARNRHQRRGGLGRLRPEIEREVREKEEI